MTKKQVLGILRKHFVGEIDEDGAFRSAPHVNYDAVATEIISLFHTGQTEVVIDPEKETLPDVDPDRVKWIEPH